MRKLYLLSIILLATQGLLAQYIHIPDDNFRQALQDDYGIYANSSHEILLAEAQALNELILEDKGISDLTGIEGFSNLKWLYCQENNLTSLDVRSLTQLEILNCYDNELRNLEVEGLENLWVLACNNNRLSKLDVGSLTGLLVLICNNNDLRNLDVRGLENLFLLDCFENNLISIDLRNTPGMEELQGQRNPDLQCIIVDDLMNTPLGIVVDQDPIPFTTEPCLSSFDDLSSLVESVGLPWATEATIMGTLKLAEESCSAGSKWAAIASLHSVILMTSRAYQLGRLSASAADEITGAVRELIDGIQSGDVACSGQNRSMLDWINSWFNLEASEEGNTPDAIADGTRIGQVQRIYPNPTSGRVNFSQPVKKVEVYNTLGQLMMAAKNTGHLNMEELQPGMYVIQLSDGIEQSVHQVVRR